MQFDATANVEDKEICDSQYQVTEASSNERKTISSILEVVIG